MNKGIEKALEIVLFFMPFYRKDDRKCLYQNNILIKQVE